MFEEVGGDVKREAGLKSLPGRTRDTAGFSRKEVVQMAMTYPKEVEVERIDNVAKNFGWELVKQEMIGEDFHITFKKEFPIPVELAAEPEEG